MNIKRLSFFILALVVLFSTIAYVFPSSVSVSAEETTSDLINLNTAWKYLDDGSDPAGTSARTSWTEAGFDDSSWKTNAGKQAKFGAKAGAIGTFNNGITPTVLLNQYKSDGKNIPAYFFRATFEVESLPEEGTTLVGIVTYDDAAIIYINGKRVYSFAEPAAGFSSNLSYGANPAPAAPEKAVMVVDSSVLRVGKNVIAVELHQANATSSDIYFEMTSLNFGVGGQEYLSMNVGRDETERNFTWYFPLADGRVEYAERDGDDFPSEYETVSTVATKHKGTYIHRATIAELKPETEYVYRIANDKIVSQNYYFETDSEDSFNFLFVSDPQIGASGNMDNDAVGWKATLKLAEEMFPDTSLLISAGDQIDWDINEEQYRRFLAPSELSSLALAPTIGNHDAATSLYSEHFNNPNNTLNGFAYGATEAGGDYWYTYNNALFIHLNSNNLSAAEHKAFMQAAFDANPDATWNILVMHQSLFSGGGNHIRDPIVALRNVLVPVITEFDFDVVLSGHDHIYSRSYMMTDGFTPDTSIGNSQSVTDHEGVLYLVGGTSSGSKYYGLLDDANSAHVAFKAKNVTTFTNIEVTGNSFKLTTYRTNDKSVLDTFEIKKDKELIPNDDETTKSKNIAKGCKYKAPVVESEWDANLTDGLSVANVTWNQDDWYALKNGANITDCTAEINFDFRMLYNIDTVRMHMLDGGLNNYAGITSASEIEVLSSSDGVEYTPVGNVEVKKAQAGVNLHVYWTDLVLEEPVEARYIRIKITTPATGLVMLNEIEIYGVKSPNATDPEPEPKRDNLALGKDYTASSLYESNGKVSYPDENGVTITDGIIAGEENDYKDTAYSGFNRLTADYKENGYAYITVDLGESYYLDTFVAHYATQKVGGGIKGPATMSIYVSNDNETWTEAGTVIPYDSILTNCHSATLELIHSVSGRYVQYRFTGNVNWIFICEVEAYEGDKPVIPAPDYTLGDVNGKDGIEKYDYILVKRAVMGTIALSDVQELAADVNKKDGVEKYDYILVKRHVMGTYTISG